MAEKSASRSSNAGKRKNKPVRKRGWNYPRQGYGPIHRWIPSWRVVFASFFATIALGVSAFATLYITTEVPQPGDFALAQTTRVYYSDGQTEMGTFAEYQRETVALEKVPTFLQQALVASEDKTFYTNNGIDLKGIFRALVNNVSGGARQGGSTLTQQYVERYYLGGTTGYMGKIKEAVLALKINREQTKEEILENYLNTIYFGRGAYGVEIAAQKYFGVSVSELNLSQSALLIAVIPSPSRWDPAVNPERAKFAWERVLNRMVEEGYISQDERNAQTFPETIEAKTSNAYAGPNGYLLSTVISELVASEQFTEDDLNQNGLKIVTTIDKDKQEAAVASVASLPEDRPKNHHVGLISIDPRNGEIYALYGGEDYLVRQRNNVTQDIAQAGSTFKPFALLAALEQGVSLNKTYDSKTPQKFGAIEVENFDGISRGRVNLLNATKYSINTAYVALNQDIGPSNTKAAAIQAGLPSTTVGLDDTLTNVLGSSSPRAIDMAKAYSTFANQGKTVTPHIVRSVTSSSGTSLYRGNTSGVKAVDEEIVKQMNEALQTTSTRGGTAATAARLGRPVAGKTGTSSGPTSAWFVGYIPQMLTVVNMYQISPDGTGEEVLSGFGRYPNSYGGGGYPTEVWLDYMKEATRGMEVENFPKVKNNRVTREPAVTVPTQEAPQEEPSQEVPSTEPSPPSEPSESPKQETPGKKEEETQTPSPGETTSPTG